MTSVPVRFWPRTLVAQLVIVTAVAVLLSNLGVAIWFSLGQERLTERAILDRVLDRAVSATTLLATIPARQRTTAAAALSTSLLDFRVHRGKTTPAPMTESEKALAARLSAMLPKTKTRRIVLVKYRRPTTTELKRQRSPDTIIEFTLPVVRGTQLVMIFYHQPPPPWPMQSIIATAMAILAASVAAGLVARQVARPLSKLTSAAAEVARGGTAPRVPEQGPLDVRRAASAFNAMTDQVTRTMESQRQLLSAVGHDLRTPITAMRINTEFIEDADTRERIEKNIEELQELTEAVLSAAKGVGWEKMRRIDLSALVESLCTDMEEMGAPVAWSAHSAAPLTCRPNEIRRAIRNLIENAVSYGKKAAVHLEEKPEVYEIIVEDDGPGIPKSEQERVFEPFVRLETSRSSETGGTGLGLTLVKAIAQGHGGAISLHNRDGGGLSAILCLPRDKAIA